MKYTIKSKIYTWVAVFLILLPLSLYFSPCAHCANKMWWATCLTGGTSGCLDALDGDNLTDGDSAVVVRDNSGTYEGYFYRLEDTAAAESSPLVISPDTNAGNKRWRLLKIFADGIKTPLLTLADDSTLTLPAAAPEAASVMVVQSDGSSGWSSILTEITLPQITDLLFPDGVESASDGFLTCVYEDNGAITMAPCGAKTTYTEPEGTLKAICATGTETTGACDPTAHPGGFSSIEIGHTSDTTIARAAAGDVTVEGVKIFDRNRVVTATKTSAYTIGTDDANEAYGGVIYVTSAAVITAPAVAVGMSFTVITIGAIAVSLDVNANDKMYLDGVLLDDGDKATNTSTTGDTIVCTYFSADGWYCMSGSPDGDHWTDGGA